MQHALTILISFLAPEESLEEDDTGRVRRRAVFGDEDDEMDVSDADDDEDEEDEDDMIDDEEESDEENNHVPRRGEALSKFDTRNIPKKGDKDLPKDTDQDVVFADSDSDFGDEEDEKEMVNVDGRKKPTVPDLSDDAFSDADASDDIEMSGEVAWKDNMATRAEKMFFANRRINLMSLIYNDLSVSPEQIISGKVDSTNGKADLNDSSAEEEDDDDEFFKLDHKQEAEQPKECIDSTKEGYEDVVLDEWDDEQVSYFFIYCIWQLSVQI